MRKRLTHLRRGEIYDQDGPASFKWPCDGRHRVRRSAPGVQDHQFMGTKWADDGFGWISYRAFAANVRTAIVIEDKPGVVTPPAPEPTPPPAPAPTPAPSRVADMAAVARLIENEIESLRL